MQQLPYRKPKQLESAVASVTPEVCFNANDMVPPSFREILSYVKQTLVILVGVFLYDFGSDSESTTIATNSMTDQVTFTRNIS